MDPSTMVKSTSPGYVLLDPRPIATAVPYTFFLPNTDELAALASGDLVQLMFEHVPSGHKWGVERMWVTVNTLDAKGLTGTLVNNPLEPTASVRAGDLIRFARYNVIGVNWANPEVAPPPTVRREYWERCLVDDCVLDGTEPVEFIYREAPSMDEGGNKYPDSGWRIRGRMGDATNEEANARKPQDVSIGAVLNRDDSWLHLIDTPVGVRLMRDFQKNVYVNEVG
ncbi:MAG: DUF2185 domain-containing protein [Usitatibacteraceae bacterium]